MSSFVSIKYYILLFSLGLVVVTSNSLFSLPSYSQQANLIITHGVASGDITDHNAIIWSRSNKQAQMHVEYDTNSNFSSSKRLTITTTVNETTDFTGHAKVHGLLPDTLYYYRVWFTGKDRDSKNNDGVGSEVSYSMTGTFR